jgi:uncharacterized protein (TIGR02147 family)
MVTTLTDFDDYRSYLKHKLTLEQGSRGRVSRLSEVLGCQSSFLSQVLSEKVHLSFEHAEAACRFLAFNEAETDYFINMAHENRAGTPDLKRYYREKMREARERLGTVKTQLGVGNEIKEKDQSTYYSQWWFSAIHILSALPQHNTRALMAEKLGLPLSLVNDVVRFLIQAKLVKETPSGLAIGAGRVHIDKQSPLLIRHHTNWRLKAIDLIGRADKDDLNYSAVIGISAHDALRIRQLLLDSLRESESILEKSKEALPYMMNIDFNRLR